MPDRTAIHNSSAPADERCVNETIFARDTAVKLAVLGGNPPIETSGRVLETSEGRVLVATPAKLPSGMPVRMEGNDALVLGEICSVERQENEWIAAVEIAHSLGSLAELERFNRALLGDGRPNRQQALIPSLRSSAE